MSIEYRSWQLPETHRGHMWVPDFVPGMNAVVTGAALAAGKLGWEVVGIRDGFRRLAASGSLLPRTAGWLTSIPKRLRTLIRPAGVSWGSRRGSIRFTSARSTTTKWSRKWICPMSVLGRLQEEGIDGLISVVGGRGLSILYKLHRKGLNAVCIPRSIENDIAATSGVLRVQYRTQLHHRDARQGPSGCRVFAQDGRGGGSRGQAGWLALQAGIAVCADAVLIPEIPADLQLVAARLKEKVTRQAAVWLGGGG
jgi:ATP-dependent phosphofructokinase / diphosphate-dependent phosphofructokinase